MTHQMKEMLRRLKEEQGFMPPGMMIAKELGEDFQEIIANYHHHIWAEGVIPLKYKYLMALATAVTGKESVRAVLETKKALNHGATEEEIKETLQLSVWLSGAPALVEVAHEVLSFLKRRKHHGPVKKAASA